MKPTAPILKHTLIVWLGSGSRSGLGLDFELGTIGSLAISFRFVVVEVMLPISSQSFPTVCTHANGKQMRPTERVLLLAGECICETERLSM